MASFDSPSRYNSFVEHFASVSYGNHLFGTFVLLPLQQRLPVSLRRLVWEDYPWVLRILSVPLSKVRGVVRARSDDFVMAQSYSCKVPFDVKLFLYPVETDEGLVRRYLSCLASDDLR